MRSSFLFGFFGEFFFSFRSVALLSFVRPLASIRKNKIIYKLKAVTRACTSYHLSLSLPAAGADAKGLSCARSSVRLVVFTGRRPFMLISAFFALAGMGEGDSSSCANRSSRRDNWKASRRESINEF